MFSPTSSSGRQPKTRSTEALAITTSPWSSIATVGSSTESSSASCRADGRGTVDRAGSGSRREGFTVRSDTPAGAGSMSCG